MKRDSYWDTLKFILIFFVVYGHMISAYTNHSSFNCAMYNFIFLFHMPLFVFISGRFSHIRDRKKYVIGMRKLLETYIVFQIIRSILVLKGEELSLHFIVSSLFCPRYTLWFILSLLFWRLLVCITSTWFLDQNPKTVIVISFLISLLGGFIPVGSTLSLQRTMAFLPFFIMGYYSVDIDIKKYIRKIPILYSLGGGIVVFLLLYVLNVRFSIISHCKYSYFFNPKFSPIILLGGRGVFLVSATVISMMMMSLTIVSKRLSHWGESTLFIYLFHSFVVQILRSLISSGYISQNEFLLFVYAVLITLSLVYLSHYRVSKYLLNPISYMGIRYRST